MKNQTRFKSFNVVESDPRVVEVYQDPDGLWMDLDYGFTADPRGAHDIHEDTVRDVMAKYRDIEVCACQDCATVLAKRAAVPKLIADHRQLVAGNDRLVKKDLIDWVAWKLECTRGEAQKYVERATTAVPHARLA